MDSIRQAVIHIPPSPWVALLKLSVHSLLDYIHKNSDLYLPYERDSGNAAILSFYSWQLMCLIKLKRVLLPWRTRYLSFPKPSCAQCWTSSGITSIASRWFTLWKNKEWEKFAPQRSLSAGLQPGQRCTGGGPANFCALPWIREDAYWRWSICLVPVNLWIISVNISNCIRSNCRNSISFSGWWKHKSEPA